MKYKINLTLLSIFLIPAFTGYPLNHFDLPAYNYFDLARLFYFILVQLLIVFILGIYGYRICLSLALIITLSVSGMGIILSFMFWAVDFGQPPQLFMKHYIQLSLNMLTVIPLSLTFVTNIPFGRIEKKIFISTQGISLFQKLLLMFMRVFNHIVYFVLPSLLEVLREESFFKKQKKVNIKHRILNLGVAMARLGLEGICFSLQHIPLWVVEISQLPQKNK